MISHESRVIMLIAAFAGVISMGYFLGLALCAEPVVAAIILLAGWILALRKVGNRNVVQGAFVRWPAMLVLSAGCALIVWRASSFATRWGDWDAWGIWNYHARFLLHRNSWKAVFESTQYDHPDYPFGLPALLAFFARICGGRGWMIIPFIVSICFTMLIPVLVYLQFYTRSLVWATASLGLFAFDDYYLSRGVSQYADTMLAAWFLMSVICIHRANRDKRMIFLSAFFAGCAAWTKNEGIVLAILLIVFNARSFFCRNNFPAFLAGAGLPLVTLLIFKSFFAPGNDLFQMAALPMSDRLTDARRYALIWQSFCDNVTRHFQGPAIGAGLYVVICAIRGNAPERPMLLIAACIVVYMAAYLLTPYDVQWHLHTSQDRLLHQLMPATMYVVGDYLLRCGARSTG